MVQHTFDVDLAQEFGIVQAILIHHFQYWIRFNQYSKQNFIENRTWTYQTLDQICAHHTYLTVDQIRYSIDNLVEKKVLKKGNFNKNVLDRTVWYSFVEESRFVSVNKKMFTKWENSQMHMGESPNATYIQDTKQEYKKENKQRKIEERTSHPPPTATAAPPSASAPVGFFISSRRKKIKEEFQEVADGIFLTPTQIKSAQKYCGNDEGWMKKSFETLSHWKIAKGFTGGKGDYLQLTKWVFDSVKNEKDSSFQKEKTERANQKIAEKVWNKFKNRGDISLGYNYLEFINGPTVILVYFSDGEFKKKIIVELKKRKIRLIEE